MPLFRPHRGLLADAMAEVEEIKTLPDMVEKIKRDLEPYAHNYVINENTVKVEPYGYDDRINWDTYIVTLKDYGVIGFTNGNLQAANSN